jgi:hypothetical protein
MTAIGERGAAKGIAERLGPKERRRLAVGGERGTAVLIEGGAFFTGEPVQNLLNVGFDVGQLFLPQRALEHVKAAAPIGLDDVGRQAAAGVEADRPAVAELSCATFPRAQERPALTVSSRP